MIDRVLGLVSGRLPAISVALVVIIIAGVFVTRVFLPGDEITVPIPVPDAPVVSQAASPVPVTPAPAAAPAPAPTGTTIPSTPTVTATALFEPGTSGTLTSPDGAVTVNVGSDALDTAFKLSYVPLAASQLPGLPEGYSAADVAFDLVPTTVQDVEIDALTFNTPIEIAILLR